ncbi:UNVERIFIED_CONTAM: hypothetical protein FKN15_013084 [Acipenser sinensis]
MLVRRRVPVSFLGGNGLLTWAAAAGNLIDTSQQVASEAPSRCIDEASTSNTAPPAEHGELPDSDATHVKRPEEETEAWGEVYETPHPQPPVAAAGRSITAAEYIRSSLMEMRLMRRHMQARQQTLFQQAEQHETMSVFSGFLHSIAEAVGPTPTVDAGTDPVVASPGREQGMIARGQCNCRQRHPPKRGVHTRGGGPAPQ